MNEEAVRYLTDTSHAMPLPSSVPKRNFRHGPPPGPFQSRNPIPTRAAIRIAELCNPYGESSGAVKVVEAKASITRKKALRIQDLCTPATEKVDSSSSLPHSQCYPTTSWEVHPTETHLPNRAEDAIRAMTQGNSLRAENVRRNARGGMQKEFPPKFVNPRQLLVGGGGTLNGQSNPTIGMSIDDTPGFINSF